MIGRVFCHIVIASGRVCYITTRSLNVTYLARYLNVDTSVHRKTFHLFDLMWSLWFERKNCLPFFQEIWNVSDNFLSYHKKHGTSNWPKEVFKNIHIRIIISCLIPGFEIWYLELPATPLVLPLYGMNEFKMIDWLK